MSRSTIKSAIDNIGEQTLPLSITPRMLADAINAFLSDALLHSEMDATPTANSTNPVTSGGVKAALDTKAEANHSHTFIGNDEGSQSAYVNASEGMVHIEVHDNGSGGECDITPTNIGNLVNALNNPHGIVPMSDVYVDGYPVEIAMGDNETIKKVFVSCENASDIELIKIFSFPEGSTVHIPIGVTHLFNSRDEFIATIYRRLNTYYITLDAIYQV